MIRPVLRLSVLFLICLILSLAGPGAVRAQQAAPAAAASQPASGRPRCRPSTPWPSAI